MCVCPCVISSNKLIHRSTHNICPNSWAPQGLVKYHFMIHKNLLFLLLLAYILYLLDIEYLTRHCNPLCFKTSGHFEKLMRKRLVYYICPGISNCWCTSFISDLPVFLPVSFFFCLKKFSLTILSRNWE
jgi:hypothetical protein